MRKLMLIALLGSLSGLFAAGELSGRRAPGFALPDRFLNYHDLYDHRGQVVLLEIMQTSCPTCLALSKNLKRVKDKYGERVAVISIVTPPDTQATVGKYLADHQLTMPVLFDSGQVTASYLKITPQKPTAHFPHLFVIDRDGMIRNDFGHSDATSNILEGDGIFVEVDKLLSPKPASAAPAKGKK